MNGRNYFREVKKLTTLKKRWMQLFPELNTVIFYDHRNFF